MYFIGMSFVFTRSFAWKNKVFIEGHSIVKKFVFLERHSSCYITFTSFIPINAMLKLLKFHAQIKLSYVTSLLHSWLGVRMKGIKRIPGKYIKGHAFYYVEDLLPSFVKKTW